MGVSTSTRMISHRGFAHWVLLSVLLVLSCGNRESQQRLDVHRDSPTHVHSISDYMSPNAETIAEMKASERNSSPQCQREISLCARGNQANYGCEDCWENRMSDREARDILTLVIRRLLEKFNWYNSNKDRLKDAAEAAGLEEWEELSGFGPHPFDMIGLLINDRKDGRRVVFANVASQNTLLPFREPRPKKVWFNRQEFLASTFVADNFQVHVSTWPLQGFDTSDLTQPDWVPVLKLVVKYAKAFEKRKVMVLSKQWIETFSFYKVEDGTKDWTTTITLSDHPAENFYLHQDDDQSWELMGNNYEWDHKYIVPSIEMCRQLIGCEQIMEKETPQ